MKQSRYGKPLKKLRLLRARRQVIQGVRSGPQQNKPVVSVHKINTTNAGDFYSGPHHYFPQLKGTAIDLMDYKHEDPAVRDRFREGITGHSLIIGGGGLLNRRAFQLQMGLFKELAEKGKKTVLWGVGHNHPLLRSSGSISRYSPDVSGFGLVGTRDYSMPGEWVPCVSALHPAFDKRYEVTREHGIVLHLDTFRRPELVQRFRDFPVTCNTSDFDELIRFIGASEKIVTDSYHAMYWSLLLGKKVVVVPKSSKFFDFKYPPLITDFDHALSDLAKARPFGGLLEECRTINYRFAEKVFDYLGI